MLLNRLRKNVLNRLKNKPLVSLREKKSANVKTRREEYYAHSNYCNSSNHSISTSIEIILLKEQGLFTYPEKFFTAL